VAYLLPFKCIQATLSLSEMTRDLQPLAGAWLR
jgi:hypothetical protein